MRPLIGTRTVVTVVYHCPLEFAIRAELGNRPPPEVSFDILPRYVTKWTRTLKIQQTPVCTMFRPHTMKIAAFRKLKSLEIVVGDICQAILLLNRLGDKEGTIDLGDDTVYVTKSILLAIVAILQTCGMDVEKAVKTIASERGVDFTLPLSAAEWRMVSADVVKEGIRSMARYRLLGELCEAVLDICRDSECIVGVKERTVLCVVLEDAARQDKEVSKEIPLLCLLTPRAVRTACTATPIGLLARLRLRRSERLCPIKSHQEGRISAIVDPPSAEVNYHLSCKAHRRQVGRHLVILWGKICRIAQSSALLREVFKTYTADMSLLQ